MKDSVAAAPLATTPAIRRRAVADEIVFEEADNDEIGVKSRSDLEQWASSWLVL